MKIVICGVCLSATDFFKMITIIIDMSTDLCYREGCSFDLGESAYLSTNELAYFEYKHTLTGCLNRINDIFFREYFGHVLRKGQHYLVTSLCVRITVTTLTITLSLHMIQI